MSSIPKIRNQILYILVLIPLLKPESFEQIPWLDTVFNILRIMSALVILIIYISENRKIDVFMTLLVLYFALSLFSTVINSGSLYMGIVRFVSTISIILLTKLLIDKDPLLFFDTFLPVLEALLYLNFLSILLYPNGLYTYAVANGQFQFTENWILGVDNAQTVFYLAGIAISVCRNYYLTGKCKLSFRALLLIITCCSTVLIRQQGQAIIALSIVILALIIVHLVKKAFIFNIWTYSVVIFMFFILIVLLHKQQYLSFFIEHILQKSSTFSGRTFIWINALFCIAKKPWFGWGILTAADVWNYIGHIHAHNLFLQILFEGGITKFITFIGLYFVTAIKLAKSRTHYFVVFLSLIIFSFLLIEQVEQYQNGIIFVIFYLAYRSDRIINTYGGKDKCLVQQVP